MHTISRKILLSLLLATIIVLGGLGAIEIRNVQHTEELKLANEATLATKRLAHNMIYPLWNLSREGVESTIMFEIRADMVSAVIVQDENGGLFAGKVELPDGSVENWNPDKPAHRLMAESAANKFSKNIVHNDKTIGTVVLYTNDLYLKELLRTQILQIIVKLTVLVFILFWMTYTMLRRLVVNPLIILKDWAATVTADTMTVAPMTGQSIEFVSLTSAINRMNHDLVESYNNLHEQTVMLETEMAEKQIINEELQEKTAELEEEIEERQLAQQNLEEQTTVLEEEIAERERIQQEHDRLEEQLLQSPKMEAIGLLASGVAHDFNNILSVIMGYGDLLAGKLTEEKVHDHAAQILKASGRAVELTKGLLAFSRKQQFFLERVDINQLTADSCKFLKRVIGEDIELVSVFQSTPLFLSIDRAQIQQVLMNLATNSRDAMPRGGKLTISITAKKLDDAFIAHHGFGNPGDYAVIEVSDTGSGMDKATALRIFEPFFTTKEKGKGTGLGLSIIHGIIAQHGGFIQCFSEQGQGTMFTIYLPLCETSEPIVAPAAVIDRNSLRGTETILLADDDEMLMEVTTLHLESSGYRVLKAFDGTDAVDIFRNHAAEIDLVILDAIMPKMTGKQAWELIRELRPEVKACFLSGYASEIISGKIAIDYSLPFISKPVMPAELLRRVREMLDGGATL